MITDGKKWHYLAVKKLSALLIGITSKHNEDLYCLNCFYSFTTEDALKKHENVCKNHDYCYVEMPGKDIGILKHNPGERYMKVPFIIYADLQCLLENISSCHNGPNKSSTTKINKHTPSGHSLFRHCLFDNTKNMLSYYIGKDCIEMLCKDLKKDVERIMYWKEKEMVLLTDEESRSYENQKLCYICKKKELLRIIKK